MDREQLAGHQLSMEDLDQVAGGTHKEDFAIFQAIKKNSPFLAVINQSYGGNNEKGWVKAFKDLLGVKMKWGYNSSGIISIGTGDRASAFPMRRF